MRDEGYLTQSDTGSRPWTPRCQAWRLYMKLLAKKTSMALKIDRPRMIPYKMYICISFSFIQCRFQVTFPQDHSRGMKIVMILLWSIGSKTQERQPILQLQRQTWHLLQGFFSCSRGVCWVWGIGVLSKCKRIDEDPQMKYMQYSCLSVKLQTPPTQHGPCGLDCVLTTGGQATTPQVQEDGHGRARELATSVGELVR